MGCHRADPDGSRNGAVIARGLAAAGTGKRVAGHGHQAVSAGEKIPVLFNTHDIAHSPRMTRQSLPGMATRAAGNGHPRAQRLGLPFHSLALVGSIFAGQRQI